MDLRPPQADESSDSSIDNSAESSVLPSSQAKSNSYLLDSSQDDFDVIQEPRARSPVTYEYIDGPILQLVNPVGEPSAAFPFGGPGAFIFPAPRNTTGISLAHLLNEGLGVAAAIEAPRAAAGANPPGSAPSPGSGAAPRDAAAVVPAAAAVANHAAAVENLPADGQNRPPAAVPRDPVAVLLPPLGVPERAIHQFNNDNGHLKRVLDIILGEQIHNPTAGYVKEALKSLLENLRVKPNLKSLEISPAQALHRHATWDVMRYAVLREEALELGVFAGPEDVRKLRFDQAKRHLKAAYIKMAEVLRFILSMLNSVTDDTNLIVVQSIVVRDEEAMVEESVDKVFLDLVRMLDVNYGHRVRDMPSVAIFLDNTLELGNDFPSLAPLLNRAPRSQYDGPIHFDHHLNTVTDPHPVTIAERRSQNRDLVLTLDTCRQSTLYRADTAELVYNFCKETPGCYFEVRAETGCGKTLLIPNILAGLGTVLLVMINDFHVKSMFDYLKAQGFSVEIRTERYAKYGHLGDRLRNPIFQNLHPGDEIEPAFTRSKTYNPMRSHKQVELYICTYEVLRQLIKNRDFPDVLILDDVRSKDHHKDLSLFLLSNSETLPKDLIIGGLSAGPSDTGRFNFSSILSNPHRPKERHMHRFFNVAVPRQHPVHQVPEEVSFFFLESSREVVARVANDARNVRERLLEGGRPELLPALEDITNQTLFQQYAISFQTMETEPFAAWVLNDFFPRLNPHGNHLMELLRFVAGYIPAVNRNALPESEHTRLLSGPLLDDAIRFYESKITSVDSGNCLIFLPSVEAVILVNRYLRHVSAARSLDVIPIVGPHSVEEMQVTTLPLILDRVLRTVRGRVVLVSPAAEASVTLPNVSFIIDTRLTHQIIVDNQNGVEYSLTMATNDQVHSQRVGRGGRTMPTVYLPLPFDSDPDILPANLNLAGSDRIEIRSLILELLLLKAYTGEDMQRDTILQQLTSFYQGFNISVLDSTLALMRTDGIVAGDKDVFLTRLGFLVAAFPGSYDESYLVAIGGIFGCFRSMAAYVVCRNSLDDFWNGIDRRSVGWREFYARGEGLSGDHYLDYIHSVMYWYLKSENDSLACLRANVIPSRFLDLKFALHRYEVAMYAFNCAREFTDPNKSWSHSHNDDSLFARRMALFAGSHGNLCLYDGRNHILTLVGQTVPRSNHPVISGDHKKKVCFGRPMGIGVFTKLRSAEPYDEVYGLTCGGFLIPLLSIDVAQPDLVDVRTEHGSLVLRSHLVAHGNVIEDIVAVRAVIANLVKGWIGGSWQALRFLVQYIALISNFMRDNRAVIPDFVGWNDRVFSVGNPFPPAGLARRRKWCCRCLHQAHIAEECLVGLWEVINRHDRCSFVLEKLNLKTPVRDRSDDVKRNGYKIVNKPGTDIKRCCHTCYNLFHELEKCRSADRSDGCIRCAQMGHSHTACPAPESCRTCDLRIHVPQRCSEDRLLLQQVFHLSVTEFIKKILIPKSGTNAHWSDAQLARRIPTVTNDYYLFPRVGQNIVPADPAGPEREIFEEVEKGLL